ncbi:hypothetical protein JTB14_026882 [Gonioctena quinquepunctata]|nr:hypothetical protein JTB14_026882 [Gonioctena quinquepunctata]
MRCLGIDREIERATKYFLLYSQANEEVRNERKIRAAAREYDLYHVSLDTPKKEAIKREVEERKKNREYTKKNFDMNSKSAAKNHIFNKNKNEVSIKSTKVEESSDEEDYFCLVCVEPYGSSKPGEKWVQGQPLGS